MVGLGEFGIIAVLPLWLHLPRPVTSVRLRRRAQPPGPFSGPLEAVADDPFAPHLGEHRLLEHESVGAALVVVATDPGVLALGVFPHDEDVRVRGGAIAQRGLCPRQQPHRAQVDVLADRDGTHDRRRRKYFATDVE
jgi:hypothetical protein